MKGPLLMPDTAEVIRRFNAAFTERDVRLLDGLVAEACVMEAIQPAPDGTRVEGREHCVAFWEGLIDDPRTTFAPVEVHVSGERATIRWRYRFGPGPADYVRGVNLMTVRDGQIVEALGYAKVPAIQNSTGGQ